MPLHIDDPLYLRLSLTRGIGPRLTHRLLSELGDINAVFQTSALTLVPIIGEKPAHALVSTPDKNTQALIDAACHWLEAEDQHLLNWAHPRYPQVLIESGDAPVVLYAKGRLDLLDRPAVAIVGSRNCSHSGNDDAEAFAEILARSGVTVISGMALGIDAAAHVGALRAGAAGGSTIAVIGTGIDRIYPARNKNLAHSLTEQGLMLSEYPLGTPPLSENFPRRNRIISGLSRGVLVVEASIQSGSLITARLAAEQGREVFAIPGSIHSTFHKGCHQLIKQGAKLVETAADILDELQLATASVQKSKSAPVPQSRLHGLLEHVPIDIESLSARSALTIDVLVAELTMLELEGTAEQLPDGRWQRRA